MFKLFNKLKNDIPKPFKIVLFMVFGLQTYGLYAQTSISGQVKDPGGVPLPGVNILVKGTTNGSQTDFDGNYSIDIQEAEGTLVFSYVGFSTQEVAVNGRSTINVTMKEDVTALEDVVVIGYGTQNKRDLVGSVTQLGAKDIEDLPLTSVDQALVAQVPGVQFRQTGNPGAGPQILIRGISSLGNNAPLYVIDGIPLTNVTNSSDNFLLNYVNPEDIENISILRDANAKAIYGNRGSNGVVIITTKQGEKGKTTFNFNSYTSLDWVQDFDKPNNLNALELATFQKERLDDRYIFNGGWGGLEQAHYTRLQDFISKAQNDTDLAKGTNWFDEITRTAVTQDYYLSAQGGSEKIVYSLSGGFREQEGVVVGTKLKRITLRANVESDVTDWLKVGMNIAPSFVTNQSADTDPNSGGYSAYSAVNASMWVDPTASVYDENGNINPSTFGILSRQDFDGNPVPFGSGLFWARSPLASIRFRDQESKTNTFNIASFIEIKPMENLVFKTSGYLNYRYRRTFNYTPKELPPDGLTPPVTGRENSSSSVGMEETSNFIFDNQLTYTNTFAEKHDLEATLVSSIERRSGEFSSLNAVDFIDEEFIYPNFGNTDPGNVSNFTGGYGDSELNRLSFLGRVSYDYDNKYYIGGSYRLDASSRFSSENRWGDFYAFNLAWRISEEAFWDPIKNTISNLRIEGGYGISGNDANVKNFQYQGNIGSQNYIFGGALFPGYGLNALPNTALTWEQSEELNLGLNIGLFNKFNLELNYYDISSVGFLGNTPIPTSTGLGGIIDNVGSISNKGFELALSTVNLVNTESGFSYNFNVNVSTNKNEAIDLPDDEIFIGTAGNGTSFAVIREGDPIGIFRGYNVTGFYSQEDLDNPDVPKYPEAVVGAPKIQDGDGDGIIEFSQEDYVDLGDPNPEFTYGMRHNFAYKNFDLSILLNGATGFQIYDQRSQQMHNLDGQFNVDRAVLTDRYRPGVEQDIVIPATPNLPNGAVIEARPETPLNSISIPTTKQNTTKYWRSPNSYHIKDADYLWVKNITLGYNISGDVFNEFISRARIYTSIQNPFVFSKYDFGSPEVQKTSDNLVRGVNEGSYPNSVTLTVGLNLTF
ncbi:SusC/RagA family TonB-linked outer membrane protein [Galbibacter mesophilus]|uniref:SusC/RagA family TonB-linked outer membrane protein n=1 Tax=Galbibacter mesophilus TaxID=379069 RepID=UPI00191CF0ED|nr:TonB-dependent receptor [Galbibacter mesophilus]MCM5663866.1 TonB-dependent receptor [Galbibacter mesophilus]